MLRNVSVICGQNLQAQPEQPDLANQTFIGNLAALPKHAPMEFIIKYALPVFYIVIIAWLLQRNKYLKNYGFAPWFIVLFFVGKCFSGLLFSYISMKYIPNPDMEMFFNDGLHLYQTFMRSPSEFVQLLRKIFDVHDINLMDTKSDFIRAVFDGIKFFHFILNLFSFGNFNTNIILFNGIAAYSFLRCWAFLNTYLKTPVAGIWIFLFPSAFFYTSGMLKEGFTFTIICAMIPLAVKMSRAFTAGKLLSFFLLFILLFFFKFLNAVTFLAAIFLWAGMLLFPQYKKWTVAGFIVLVMTAFFTAGFIKPSFNFPQYIINRQIEFLELKANSMLPYTIPEPNFISFLKALPRAVNNVLFKPLPGEGGKFIYIIYTIEIFGFWAILFFALAKNKFKMKFRKVSPLLWSLFLFALANLVIIGFTISNIGAITRYRSIFLPFVGLFCWMAFNGDQLLPEKLKKRLGYTAALPE